MKCMDRKIIDNLREMFPKGTRVVLVYMDDPQAPPEGTEGSVRWVDDTGTVHVEWDNGSSLGAVYGADRISKI
jgi:hypothetical protein